MDSLSWLRGFFLLDVNRSRSRIILLLGLVCGLWLLPRSFHAALGITADAFAEPSEQDNFYEARSRFWAPEEMGETRGLLVILHGTDSDARGEVDSAFWRRIARRERLSLLGCYFRGEGEPYEDAAGGSGAALLKMIGQIAATTKIRGLDNVPLVFVGHSAGAMFAYQFTAWAPQKVAGFVAVKTGPITPGSDPRAAAVPGLFIVGECDLNRRVHSAAEAFLWQKHRAGMASFAIEPNHGHEWTPAIGEFIDMYVKGICALPSFRNAGPTRSVEISSQEGCWRDLQAPFGNVPLKPQEAADAVWLPSTECAMAWARFTNAGSVQALAERTVAPEAPPLEVKPGMVSMDAAQWGEAFREVEQLVTIRDGSDEPLECTFAPEDSRLTAVAARVGPNAYRLQLRLSTKDMIGPRYRTAIHIEASSKTEQVYSASLTVSATIASAFRLTPASVYAGVLSRGEVVERSVTIACKDNRIWKLLAVKSSNPAFAQARLVNTSGGGSTLVCHFTADKVLGNQSGHFEMVFDHDAQTERVSVPFIAFASKKTAAPEMKAGR